MPGLYTHTTRATGTILTATIYNSDHQNHIDNHIPQMIDDYSVNVAQMQSAVDPGEVGSESLPSSLAGELERLRFIIKEITGKAQWYETPAANLSAVGTGLFTSTDAGAGEGPTVEMYRDSASPAADDLTGAAVFTAESSTGVKRTIAKILSKYLDPTNAAEDAELHIQTMVAGALATMMILGQGVQIGPAATGGDPGVGNMNVDGRYLEDGWILTGAAGTLTDAANIAWDLKGSRIRSVTLGGNRTLDNPTNLRAGTYILVVTQDGTGSRTLAYGTSYLFEGGTDPTLSTAAGAKDMLIFVCDGTNMLGSIIKGMA